MKHTKREHLVKFKRSLAQLYEPGMIEYFWNRELNRGRKETKI
jgi:hypothetical protein